MQLVLFLVSLLGFSGASLAAIPASMTTAITTISTDSSSLIDSVVPIVASIFGALLLIKLFKRVGNKI